MRSWPGVLLFVLVCQLAGAVGALTTEAGTSAWYRGLAKPAFQPPGWLFGPVWTLLYALMGVAAWRVWCKGTTTPGVRAALIVFGVQLLINAVWSPVFFGAHAIGPALVVLVALWAAVIATIVFFRRVERLSSLLLAPYVAWVSFAVVLNAAILSLN